MRCKQESATRYETRRLGKDDSYDDCGPRITRNMAASQVYCITITTSISTGGSICVSPNMFLLVCSSTLKVPLPCHGAHERFKKAGSLEGGGGDGHANHR